jgi:hypothetical protein
VLAAKEAEDMQRSLVELEDMIRRRICGICTDRRIDGSCELADTANCALFRLFPQVAEAIQSVHSDDIGDYIQAIRAKVCSLCSEQTTDGTCETRQQARCALDAYLIFIVDDIEEATGRSFDRSILSAPKREQLTTVS